MIRRSFFYITFVATILFLASCQSSRTKAVKLVQTMEDSVFGSTGAIDRVKVGELIDLYINFADKFSKDSLAPVYLFKAADMAMNTGRSLEAIQLYERILDNYSEYSKAPEALFLMGYVYENNLGELAKAEEIYKKFLELYPDNDFADDAEISLKYLGKSPEELIEIFQQLLCVAIDDCALYDLEVIDIGVCFVGGDTEHIQVTVHLADNCGFCLVIFKQ